MRSRASRVSSSTTESDMQAEIGIVAVTDDAGRLLEPDLLRAAEAVHRQLRAALPEDYVARLSEIFAAGAGWWWRNGTVRWLPWRCGGWLKTLTRAAGCMSTTWYATSRADRPVSEVGCSPGSKVVPATWVAVYWRSTPEFSGPGRMRSIFERDVHPSFSFRKVLK